MIKTYHKTATIRAEQFDGSREMAKRYGVELYSESGYGYEAVEGEPNGDGYVIDTLKGELLLRIGDWIATGVNGEHWLIAGDIFKKTYAELPVIPKTVADWIEYCKTQGLNLENAIDDFDNPVKVEEWLDENSLELFAQAWLTGYTTMEG